MHEARHRSTRRNPRYLHIVRRVAPSSGGHVVFVMGPLVSSPSLTHHAAGLGLLFVVDVTPPLHAIRQTERANLGSTWSGLCPPNAHMCGFTRSSVPATGPRYRRAA